MSKYIDDSMGGPTDNEFGVDGENGRSALRLVREAFSDLPPYLKEAKGQLMGDLKAWRKQRSGTALTGDAAGAGILERGED